MAVTIKESFLAVVAVIVIVCIVIPLALLGVIGLAVGFMVAIVGLAVAWGFGTIFEIVAGIFSWAKDQL